LVFANGFFGTLLSVIFFYVQGEDIAINFTREWWPSFLLCSHLGHFACCCGDTFASEVGILSKSKPFLVTNFKEVPHGTNGGISFLGTLASLLGGTFIGFVFWLSGFLSLRMYDTPQWPLIVIGSLGGLLGSLIDSFLGATLQISSWDPKSQKVVNYSSSTTKHISGNDILDNHQVNFVSAVFTSLLIGYLSQFFV